MQGVVNHLGHFTNVYVGWPGRVHDARVLANSALYVQGQEGTLLQQWNKRIGGKDVPGRPRVPSSIMGDESIPK